MSKEKNTYLNSSKSGLVGKKTKPLKTSLRKKWIGIMESAGADIGLSSCEVFLENKMANDIFFKAIFNGKPCIVKCSSIAPDSISNEYEMNSRLYKIDSSVFPEPLAHWRSDDTKFAFVVTRAISGPTLTEIASHEVSQDKAESLANDIMRIAECIKSAGIVHGDIIPDNLMLDDDGRLKLIDFQFAIDRKNPSIDPWLKGNPKFRFLLQGANSHLGLGVWNDACALIRCLEKLPAYPVVIDAIAKLSQMTDEMNFKSPPDGKDMFLLRLHLFSLHAQKILHAFSSRRRERVAGRIRKLTRLMENA